MLAELFTNLRERAIVVSGLSVAEKIFSSDNLRELRRMENMDYAERAYLRDKDGKFAPKNESGDTSTLKQRLLDKYKNPPKQTVEDFIKKEPDGKETRTYATSLAKKANELAKAKDAALEDMEDTLLEVNALKEYSDKKFDYYFYQIDEEVGDNETPESWRYQKASDALGKAYSNLDEKYQEKDQARYDRLKRKMQERGLEE